MPIKKEEIKKTTKAKSVAKKKPAAAKQITTPTASKTAQIESLAMIRHVHVKPERRLPRLKFNFKRLDQYIATNPTLWQITWSIMWRGFFLFVAVRMFFVLASSIAAAFLYDTILKLL